MESMVELVLNAENVRMLVLLVFGFCGYVTLKTSLEKRIDGVEASLNKKIDGVEASLNKKIDGVEGSLLRAIDEKIDLKLSAFYAQLKANDFAHLNNTIEALTFMLEKNKFLEKEDKEYIDRRLDR
jgi:hypothetical protein